MTLAGAATTSYSDPGLPSPSAWARQSATLIGLPPSLGLIVTTSRAVSLGLPSSLQRKQYLSLTPAPLRALGATLSTICYRTKLPNPAKIGIGLEWSRVPQARLHPQGIL
jgi:hypothetical protein